MPEEKLPKLLVVAGADTHHGGGPSHNLVDESVDISSAPPASTSSPKSSVQGGLWDDVAEDLGIPPPKELKNVFGGLFKE